MIDTPPVGLVTDGILIMRKADVPIYIVRANYSKKTFLKNINRLMRTNGFTQAVPPSSTMPKLPAATGMVTGMATGMATDRVITTKNRSPRGDFWPTAQAVFL